MSHLSGADLYREGSKRAAIFSDSRSVLVALSSLTTKSRSNYLIPFIRDKFHFMTNSGYSIHLAWVPSHWGIPGNERTDSLARQTASLGHKPKFRIPFTDFLFPLPTPFEKQILPSSWERFSVKGIMYSSHFFQASSLSKLWFFHLSLSKNQIVTLCKLRSNHYNLNYSLPRKNITASSAYQCGDPRQDVNHVIFRCPLTRHKSKKWLIFLNHRDSHNNHETSFPLS